MIAKCPRCGKDTEITGNPFRPFCSERCRLLDLGNWLSETYHISEKQPEESNEEKFHSREGLKQE